MEAIAAESSSIDEIQFMVEAFTEDLRTGDIIDTFSKGFSIAIFWF